MANRLASSSRNSGLASGATTGKSRQIRLAMYTPNYPGLTGEGGIGSYAQRLAQALQANGHTAHIVAPGKPGCVLDLNVPIHLTSNSHLPIVDRLWPGAGACWRVGRTMSRVIRENDLNVAEFPNWEGLAPWFAMRRSVPLIVRLHTSSLETIRIDGLPFNRLLRADVKRERLTARLADLLVTHSRTHQQAMAEELEIDPCRIHIVPHGIEPAGAMEHPRDRSTVVFLGRMERRKGTIDLLNAVPLVLKEVPETSFVFVGADRPHCPGNRTHAQFLADEFPPAIQARVTLAGRLPDEQAEHWLKRATVFVAPSLYESFGLTFLEAMRWATPVIGTTAGGIPEVVEHGRTGILVPPQNTVALAAAIVDLLKNEQKRRQLGEAGRLRCESEFSIQQMTDRTTALYSETIERWRG